MTMFPVHRNKNSTSFGGCYGGACGGGRRYLDGESYECFMNLGGVSDLLMADESRLREISIINNQELEAAAGGGGGSSSKEDNIHHHHEEEIKKKEEDGGGGGWLELRLGGGRDDVVVHNRPEDHQISLGPAARLVELDLLPAAAVASNSSSGEETCSQQTMMMMMQPLHMTNLTESPPPLPPDHHHHHHRFLPPAQPTFFLQQQQQYPAHPDSAMTFTHQQQYDHNFLPFRPFPALTLINRHDFSTSLEQPASHVPAGRQPLVHFHTSATATAGIDHVTGPPPRGIDQYLRVVDPPPRPHSGVWFILQPSLNQPKEPYLPQLPKSYLRIKDGRMTVRLLIKYLVNKLNLDSEFEVEITCKGQQLLPFLTLQHVRDNIWNSPRNEVVFPHSSATIDHLMQLNYGRIA